MDNKIKPIVYNKNPSYKYFAISYGVLVLAICLLCYFYGIYILYPIIAILSLSIVLLVLYLLPTYKENNILKEYIINADRDYELQEIEHNIISTLARYEIPAIVKNNGKIVNFNASAAKIVDDIGAYDDKNWLDIYLKPNRTKYITIYPPPDTIDPAEGPNFILRLPAAGAIIDQKTHVLSSNQGFSDLFDLKGKKQTILDIVDDKSVLEAMVQNCIEEGLCIPQKIAVSNGSKNCLISLNKIVQSKQPTFICQAIDISGFMYNEEEMAHSQKMQAVGQLTGSIAHDFNNLLTAMIGYSDILLGKYGPSDTGFNEIMQIRQNSVRAAELVKQLLAFSKKQVLNITSADINDIIVEMSNLLHRLLGEKVRLKLSLGRFLPHSDCDITQFEQVILNLAINARDAMNLKGELLINTYTQEIDNNFDESKLFAPRGYGKIPKGNYVVTKIKDSGSGIPQEILDQIFEPFFSTKDALSGTGLGLSTVYGIVKQFGGHIRLETEIGKGTCFYIFLKASKRKYIPADVKVHNDLEMAANLFEKQPTVQKHTILLVEDEDAVRMFEAHALKTRGYEVFEANNPLVAFKVLEEKGDEIDIIVTDVIMPEMTGPEMVEKVKKEYPKIKFLFTSGYTEDALSYFNDNNYHFLSKPFSLDKLVSMIEGIVAQDEK